MGKTPRGRWLNDRRTCITCEFGVKGWWKAGHHTGVDLAVPGHTHVPVVWALRRNGHVIQIGGCGEPYGKHVLIRGSQGRVWLFAHLDRIDVRLGQVVSNGHKIGLTGSTGIDHPGDHLHLEQTTGSAWVYRSTKRPVDFAYDLDRV